MLLNSPDCRTVGSIPAKATKADELLNLFISPISARMVARTNHAYSGNGMKITIKLLVVLKNLAVKSFNLLIKKIHSVNELF
ncbi:MAG: hypothetical protein ACLRTZ_10005 [Agathobacter sp.]